MLKIDKDSDNSDDLERLVRQGRIAVEESKEEGYVLFPGISFDTPEEVVDFYRESLQDYVEEEGLAVYGNSEELEDEVAERDTWAAFRSADRSSAGRSEWAVDALNTVGAFSGDIIVEPYERAVESLGAATLYVVARAESDGDIGTNMYSFHHGLVRYLRGEQETEYPESVVEAIEDEIVEVEAKLEDYQREKERIEEGIEQVDKELERMENGIEETDREIQLYAALIDVLESVEHLEKEQDNLDERIENAEDTSNIEQYIGILQSDIENLDSHLRDLEYGERRLHELEDRVNFLEQRSEFQDVNIQVEEEGVLNAGSRIEDLEHENENIQESVVEVGEEVEDVEDELESLEERTQRMEEELARGHGLTRVWRGTKRWYGRKKQSVTRWLGDTGIEDREEMDDEGLENKDIVEEAELEELEEKDS